MIWAGIDAGKTHHHCVAIDESGRQLLSRRVANDPRTAHRRHGPERRGDLGHRPGRRRSHPGQHDPVQPRAAGAPHLRPGHPTAPPRATAARARPIGSIIVSAASSPTKPASAAT
ncbi:transposase [Streptomyces sp. NPDC020747]|uniref:IS110 family transposase n=1 Tax=Streptomyces sp. NPDC020747 TaxID=3365086 RepID=UPI003794BA1F